MCTWVKFCFLWSICILPEKVKSNCDLIDSWRWGTSSTRSTSMVYCLKFGSSMMMLRREDFISPHWERAPTLVFISWSRLVNLFYRSTTINLCETEVELALFRVRASLSSGSGVILLESWLEREVFVTPLLNNILFSGLKNWLLHWSMSFFWSWKAMKRLFS